MLAAIVFAILGLIELIVGLRFAFLLLGANPASAFVNWIYTWSAPLVAPFEGIFNQHAVTAGTGVVVHSVFDWTALIALLVYAIIGGILGRLLAGV